MDFAVIVPGKQRKFPCGKAAQSRFQQDFFSIAASFYWCSPFFQPDFFL